MYIYILDYEVYMFGGITIFVLNSFTMYGLIRWRKVIFFQLYTKIQVKNK